MNRRPLLVLALLAIMLAACGGTGGGSAESSFAEDSGEESSDALSGDADGTSAALAGGSASEAAPAEDEPATSPADQGDGERLATATALPAQDKVIKEGTVRLEVAEDTFDKAVQEVTEAAVALGGSVVAMATSSKEGEAPSGSVTVRVPVEEYDGLISDVGGIGEVRDRSIKSKDVTAEYVDLQARLRHAEAQERFYLGLLDRAVDVQDAIAVQQQLDGLQTEIERLKGRLRFLDSRTAFSTLTVELFEPGAPRLATRPDTNPSLARYWATARAAFVTVVGTVLVTAVSLAPLLVLVAIGFLIWRAMRARTIPPPASATE